MTKEEITKRIKELNAKIFDLEMKDFWDTRDRFTINKWYDEVRELEKMRDAL